MVTYEYDTLSPISKNSTTNMFKLTSASAALISATFTSAALISTALTLAASALA